MAETRQWQDHTGLVLDSVNNFDVIECETCGFKHIVPIPSTKELEAVYQHEYYAREKPLYLERHKEDLDWWNLVYNERYETFEKHLSLGRRRILDIGSGPGFFLLHGKQRGWQTVGIEPSNQAAAHSRELGLHIVEDFLGEQTARQLGTFDVVHMQHVFEHIPHPEIMLRLAHGLLNPEGLLCVIVPNDYNPFQHALRTGCGYKPWWVAPPSHINYFNFDSLTRLMENNRFKAIMRDTTFPIDLFLLMGDNYIGNDELGRKCHGKRKALEQNFEKAGMSGVKRMLYQAFAEKGIGRDAILLCRKNEHHDF